MLGDSKEVKLATFDSISAYNTWAEKNPNYGIVDIRYSVVAAGTLLSKSFLVIYKN